ncbi:MAG TPA: beta-galactosidase [Planctomycetota bacterium]|nr:beta-galactosidase [Planctomycetota bacterium]
MPRAARDDYHVLMWNFYDPLYTSGAGKAQLAIRRFRELACNGGTLIATQVDSPAYWASLKAMNLGPAKPGKPPTPEQLREVRGCAPFLENRFPFYVMNVCRPIYWEWGQAKPVFRQWYEAFNRDRDRRVFTRPGCVNDPAVEKAMDGFTASLMKSLAPVRDLSLLYDLRDEPSITSFILAADSCFCPHCMAKMREWLKGQYADLAALNREWGTEFASWEAVEPLVSQEALERRAAGNWNFAPWADHRAFMDETFRRAVARQSELIRKSDPDATVGLAGTQCPSVFGGYDFSILVPELDWAEVYDFGGSLACYRSFKRRRHVPLLKTTFMGGSAAAHRSMLWHFAYASGGDSGTIIWQSNAAVDVKSKALRPTKIALELAEVYGELRSGAPRLLQLADETSSPVGVHYSQASIRADHITSIANRPASLAAAQPERFAAAKCREAWWTLLEDRGLRPVFVSNRQVEAGELLKRGIKLFVLPRSIAVSDAEARELEKFVAAGGTLVADSFVGRMDEHCRERAHGALDGLFGVEREPGDGYHAGADRGSFDWDAPAGKLPVWGGGPLRAEFELIEEGLRPLDGTRVLGCTEYTDVPLGFFRKHGKGRTVLFNAAPLGYLDSRLRSSAGRNYQRIFGWAAELAGVKPEAEVVDLAAKQPVPGWQVFPFRHGAARYFGLTPDLQISQDVLGAIRMEGGRGGARKLGVKLSAAGHIFEARSGRYLGRGKEAELALGPTDAPLLAVLPYRPAKLKLTFEDGKVVARLAAPGKARLGEHVLRFELLDARGRPVLDGGANAVAPGGAAEWTPEGPLPRNGRILCRDVATGLRAAVKVR